MKWYTKLIFGAAVLAFLAIVAGMVYVVHAKFTINDYNTQISLAFNAAMMVNAQETYTDEAQAVISETENGRFVVVPENYRSLSYFLKVRAAMPLFAHVDEDAPLKVSICGEGTICAEPDKNGDGATLRYITGDDKFTVHVSDPELWDELMEVCESGSYHAENIPLP